jgi:hypothetical protein
MLNCRCTEGTHESLVREGASDTSVLSSEKVVAGCFVVVVLAAGAGVSSFAGGGGGAKLSEVEDPPNGPRGSDSRSNSSRRETMDCARRDVVGRRREDCGEARGAGRRDGVEADIEVLVCVGEPFVDELGCGDDVKGSVGTAKTRSD